MLNDLYLSGTAVGSSCEVVGWYPVCYIGRLCPESTDWLPVADGRVQGVRVCVCVRDMGNSQTKGQAKSKQKKQVHWKAAGNIQLTSMCLTQSLIYGNEKTTGYT